MYCAVRDKDRLAVDPQTLKKLSVIGVAFTEDISPGLFPPDLDAVYYLIHSMSGPNTDFDRIEALKEYGEDYTGMPCCPIIISSLTG